MAGPAGAPTASPKGVSSAISSSPDASSDLELLGRFYAEEELDELDRFDRSQLADVIRVCLGARSLSEAGRRLFAASRRRKRSSNDADRLRKYLARFDLSWQRLHPE